MEALPEGKEKKGLPGGSPWVDEESAERIGREIAAADRFGHLAGLDAVADDEGRRVLFADLVDAFLVGTRSEGRDDEIDISDEFDSPLELRRHYKEALRAVDIALMLSAKDTAFYFAAFLPFYLMSLIDKERLISLHNVSYERLKAYVDRHEAGYLETLYYYVLLQLQRPKDGQAPEHPPKHLGPPPREDRRGGQHPMGNGIILQNFVLFYQIQLYLRKGKGESRPSAVSFVAKGMEEGGHGQ